MAGHRIFVTWPMEREARAILERVGTVDTNATEDELPPDALARAVEHVDAVIPMGAHPVGKDVMAAGQRLRVIAVAAVGYNLIDIATATERGILVTNTPGVLTETTADMAWALMLAVARRVVEADRFVRAGRWAGVTWSLLLGDDVQRATLGIIGLGRIGKAVARRAGGFGMRVLYHSRRPDPEANALGAAYRSMADLLREADFVVLTVPLAPETRGLIGAKELALMKPTAYLVNIARGPVVDEAALVAALEAGRIAGAGLDVFADEPRVHPGPSPSTRSSSRPTSARRRARPGWPWRLGPPRTAWPLSKAIALPIWSTSTPGVAGRVPRPVTVCP